MTAKKKFFIAVLIYLLTFLFRIYQIQETPIFGDEVTWTVWGKELIYSIMKGNISAYSDKVWYNDEDTSHPIGLPLNELIGAGHIFFTNESRFGVGLLPPIIASRVINIVINSFTPVVIFLVGGQLTGFFASFAGAVLYLLTPTVIGTDRMVVHDSILTLSTFLSIGLFVISLKKKKTSVIPGIFLGLAFLTKILGVLPILSWLILSLPKDNRRFAFKLITLNLISALTTVLILWPQMWLRPLTAIFEYTAKIIKLPGDATPNFYLGKSTLDPGPTYYLFQLFARLPEVIIFLFSLAFFQSLPKLKKVSLQAVSIVVFCIFFFLIISISPLKTNFRYVLPILPWLFLSIGSSISLLKFSLRKIVFMGATATLLLTSLSYRPDYYVYYNNLVGGPANAARLDQIPLCYATKSALGYINQKNIKGDVYIAGCQGGEPYYNSGRVFTKKSESAQIVIVGGEFRQKVGRQELESILMGKKLEKIIIIKSSPVGEIWVKN